MSTAKGFPHINIVDLNLRCCREKCILSLISNLLCIHVDLDLGSLTRNSCSSCSQAEIKTLSNYIFVLYCICS